MPKPPTAQEFRQKFFDALRDCLPDTPERQDKAYRNWTAFMTGKQGKSAGDWPEKRVLPTTAKNLGLECEREYLNLDLVFYPKGESWGNLVAVGHEDERSGFGEEVEKLMSALAPLKVGITYVWKESEASAESELANLIHRYFETRHRAIREAPETEYLFLLGIEKDGMLRWKSLSFSCADG